MHLKKTLPRWGVIGCGRIAEKFADAIDAIDGATITAAASRTPGRADEFAGKHGIGASLDDYGDLLARDDVDAVYIGTTHNFHHDNVLQALEAGKHVLCEKPLAVNARQARAMVEAARASDLFLMEAVWTRFLPAIVELRKILAEERIGTVRKVIASFGFRAERPPEDRLFNRELAGGTLLDMGIYPLQLIHLIMRRRLPLSVRSFARIGPTGVDTDVSFHHDYGEGVTAHGWSSFEARLPNDAWIIGDTGRVRVPEPFLNAKALEIDSGDGPQHHDFGFPDEQGFRFEIEEVHRCLAEGRTESAVIPLDESLELAGMMDALRAEWGLRYPGE